MTYTCLLADTKTRTNKDSMSPLDGKPRIRQVMNTLGWTFG